MVRLPKFGPKLAAPPTDLDDDSQERLDEFVRLTGDATIVATRRLLWLAVVHSGPIQLGDRTALKSAHETVMLKPHTVVMTPQAAIGARKVHYYVTVLDKGGQIKPARVTDASEDAGWWHLDGLHRLLAARILGLDLEADIWR